MDDKNEPDSHQHSKEVEVASVPALFVFSTPTLSSFLCIHDAASFCLTQPLLNKNLRTNTKFKLKHISVTMDVRPPHAHHPQREVVSHPAIILDSAAAAADHDAAKTQVCPPASLPCHSSEEARYFPFLLALVVSRTALSSSIHGAEAITQG